MSASPVDGRVLVVEDNAVNQLLVDWQLAKLGYEHEIVGAGEAAIDLLADADHGFDVVLMDWQLPGIDGVEATRRIRDLERGSGRHVPIVALTASALNSDRRACRDAGMDDFLAKPASLSALGDVISRWVSGARERAVHGCGGWTPSPSPSIRRGGAPPQGGG